MLYLIGIIISFFLAFLLIVKKNKNIADKILFFWLLLIGFHLVMIYLFFNKTLIDYPFLLGINIPYPLFHGPLLFLYTASITNQLKSWKIMAMHFIPIIISYLSIIDFFFQSNIEQKMVIANNGQDYQTITSIIYIGVVCSGIVYVIWSLVLLERHKKNILNQFSNSEKINLIWLRNLIYGVGLIWGFVIFGNDEMLFSLVVLYVIFIGYFGINQVGIFSAKVPIIDDAIIVNNEVDSIIEEDLIMESKPSKYLKSGLNPDAAQEIYALLQSRMDQEKFYKNPELTLVDLAQTLNVHPNNLSQVINTFEEKNFYDYINSKRVELFLELAIIPENKKYTILSLAYECGFNSKSSFNKHFKKVINRTPTEYLNSIGTTI